MKKNKSKVNRKLNLINDISNRTYIKVFLLILSVMFAFKILMGENNIFTSIFGFIDVIKPILFAILMAYILFIPVSKIEEFLNKRKNEFVKSKSRELSIGIVYLFIVLIIILIINWLIPYIYTSTKGLINNFPEYIRMTEKYLIENPIKIFGTTINLGTEISKLNGINLFSLIFKSDDPSSFVIQVGKVFSVANSIFDIIVTLIVSIYFLMYKEGMLSFSKKVLLAFFDKKVVNKAKEYLEKANYIFFKFFTIQILDGFIVGVIISIAFMLFKVKYGVALGFLIGLCNLIPFFGAIFAVGLSAIITIFTGGLSEAILVLIVAIVLQQLDANILNPILLGTTLEINKVLIIASVIIGGAYFGALGMFLAVPAVKVISLIVDDVLDYLILKKRKKEILTKKRKIKLKHCNKIKK